MKPISVDVSACHFVAGVVLSEAMDRVTLGGKTRDFAPVPALVSSSHSMDGVIRSCLLVSNTAPSDFASA